MPLLACCPVVVTVAAVDGFQIDADFFQSAEQIGDFFADGLLSIDSDVEGLVFAVQDDRLVDHAAVHIQHGEHHIEVNEGLRLKRKLLEDEVLHAGFSLQVLDQRFHAMHIGTCAKAADYHVVTDNLNVATFHRTFAVDVVAQHGVDDFGIE